MRTAKLKAVLLAVALVLASAACGTGRAHTVPSDHTAFASCPSVRNAGWQKWANRVHMTVFCPTWLPIYIDGVIGGDLNTAASPGRFWQVHFVWRSDDFSQLIHIVFEGYAPGTWPRTRGGGNTYVVSLHVIDPYTAATAKAAVARIVKGLVPVKPSAA